MERNKQGDIKELVDIAEPTHAIITNIPEKLISKEWGRPLECVLKTKTEALSHLIANGSTVFINFPRPDFVKT